MAECLSPFLDTSFSDPGAARFAASLKRKKSGLVRHVIYYHIHTKLMLFIIV